MNELYCNIGKDINKEFNEVLNIIFYYFILKMLNWFIKIIIF